MVSVVHKMLCAHKWRTTGETTIAPPCADPCPLQHHQKLSNLFTQPLLNLSSSPVPSQQCGSNLPPPVNQTSILGQLHSLMPETLSGHLSTTYVDGFHTVLSKRTQRHLREGHFKQSIGIEAKTFRFSGKPSDQGTALLITKQRPSLSHNIGATVVSPMVEKNTQGIHTTPFHSYSTVVIQRKA